jgi:hypothetical protein
LIYPHGFRAIVSEDFGLMIQVRNADDVAQYVRLCTLRGAALWGVDYPMDTKSIRYPLVVYIHSPWRNGQAAEGVQAYGTATRVTSGPTPVGASTPDYVPVHLRTELHRTWFRFDQILNVSPSVPHTEFYGADRERLTTIPSDRAVSLGPPYPVKHH